MRELVEGGELALDGGEADGGRFDREDPRQGARFDHRREDRRQRRPHFHRPVARDVPGGDDVEPEPLEEGVLGGDQAGLLALEVRFEGGPGDPGVAQHLLDLELGVAVLRHRLGEGRNQPRALKIGHFDLGL
jgi:hypothetical protein